MSMAAFNRHGVWAIYRFEMARAMRTLWQSLVTPVITTSLYFIVFGAAIGSRMAEVDGVSYGAFIVPGLIMLSLFTQSIFNASFGIFFPKFTGTIYEILSAPISSFEIVLAYVGAAAVDVVHQEQEGPRVVGEVSGGDVLPVAGKVGEAKRGLVDHAEKALRPASVLDVGLPVGRGCRHVERRRSDNRRREVGRDCGRPAAVLLLAGIGGAGAALGLDLFHARGEGDVGGGEHGGLDGCGSQRSGESSLKIIRKDRMILSR